MQLILWRHAEAEDQAPDGSDAQRRLTERGRRQAEKMSAWLMRHLPADAQIIASPAVRTRQTADALECPYRTDDRLFTEASVADHIALLREIGSGQTAVLVGHQPTLGELAAVLLCGQAQPWSVKKSAIWWLSLDVSTGSARLICVLDPKLL